MSQTRDQKRFAEVAADWNERIVLLSVAFTRKQLDLWRS